MRAALLRVEVEIVALEAVDGEHRRIADSQPGIPERERERQQFVVQTTLNLDFVQALRIFSISAGSNGNFCVSRILAGPRTNRAEFIPTHSFSVAKRKNAFTRSSFFRAVRGIRAERSGPVASDKGNPSLPRTSRGGEASDDTCPK
jgi:hypothetical protein